jgi:hypothetical protein
MAGLLGLLLRIPVAVDREIWTIHAAQIATGTFIGVYHVGRVVPLGVESARKFEHVGRTKGHTKTAAFTIVEIYYDCSSSHSDRALMPLLNYSGMAAIGLP